MMSSGFFCLVCAKQFNGPTPYLAHQQSDKHKKKAKSNALSTNALTDGGASTAIGSGAALTAEENTVPSPAVPAMKRKVSHSITCSICNVSLNSRITMETHIQGKHHQRRLFNEQCKRRLVNAVETEPSGAGSHSGHPDTMRTAAATSAPEKPPCGFQFGVEDMSCERCGIVLFKSVEDKMRHRMICDLSESAPRSTAQSTDDEDWDTLQDLMRLAIAQDP